MTFDSGDTSKSFSFSAVADSVDDDGENVALAFGMLPTGVTAGTTASSTVSITDDDVAAGTVSLVLTPATIDESGSSNVSTVTATLATASSADTTVTISAPQDAPVTLSSNKTLTIAKGATTSTGEVTITAVNDAVYTGDREVTVSGAASNTVGVANAEDATLTITDDEVRPVSVSFGAATYTVAEDGTVDVTVTLDAAPEREVTIPITAAGQGGASVDDYSGVPASVTFATADTSKSFTFSATQDDVDDDGESVALAFGTLPAGVTAGTTASSTVSITDDDVAAGTVSLVLTPATIDESGSSNVSTVTATLATASSADTTVTISAPQDAPVTLSSNKTLTIAKGATTSTGEVTITAVNDAVYTGDREVTVSGAASNTVGVANAEDATLTITDDEVRPVSVSFGAATYTVAEDGTVDVTVTLDAAPEREVTIPITAAGQGGASVDDYSGVPASVTFATADTSKSFTFSATQDDVDDDGESVALAFGTLPAGVTAGTTASSTVSITDDDVAAGTVSLVLTPATIDESGSSNVSTVTATLATASSADTTVTISAPQDAPVTLSSNKTLTIAKGATTSTGEVTITAVNDAVYTGDREVTVSGAASNTVGVANAEDATLTITDDEVRPVSVSFGAASYSVAEGGTADVTVTLDAAPEREVTIPIAAADQGGISEDDYSGVPASLTFAAADTSKSFTFSASADDVDDDGESVKLTFGTLPAGVTAGATGTATVSILQADASSPSIQVLFSSPSYSATEGGNNAQVTVLLSGQPQSTVDIPLTATGASGATEDDWSGVPETLTFNPGDTSQIFTVTATDDDEEDNGEMVHLVLGDLPDGFEAGEPATATITIMNDDTEETPDSACPGAVWCATLTFSSEGSLHYDDHRQAFLGWHYKADSPSNTGATLTDSKFTYRAKDYSIIGTWVFTPPHDRSTCTSELQMNIHSSDGLLADLDLFESLDASKGLKLIVDDYLEFPITVDTKRHPHMIGFLHPYFYSIRAGSTVELRIEETDIASSGGDGAAGDALAKPRCVHVSSYPHNTPETGLVGLEITWQKPSLDGSPNILSGAANVDSYKVQWKIAGDSWDNLDAVSEESSSNSLYYVILGLTEGRRVFGPSYSDERIR